jgi:putative phosphoribosyl transferase
MRFRDRHEAGRSLAGVLVEHHAGSPLADPLVLGLPRGGLPVAFEVSRGLGAPLDVFVSRKLGAPRQPELGIGAVAEGGVRVLDSDTVRMLGITQDDIDHITEREHAELERRVAHYRVGRSLPPLAGRDIVLVDDGLATGVTARAAVESLRRSGVGTIVLAVPVAAADTAARFRAGGIEVVSVAEPADFGAVGFWYDHFEQTTDDEVLDLLVRATHV